MIDIGMGSAGLGFQPLEPLKQLESPFATGQTVADGSEPGFVNILRSQLDQLIELQNQAEAMQQALIAGEADNFHEVLLSVQKADLALNFALELRNKVVEAYQEISRMQI